MADRFSRGQSVRELMTADPATVETSSSISEAARLMKEHDTGAILVTDGGELKGLLTDRDIALRAVAEGRNPDETKAGEICTTDVEALSPDQTIGDAIG